jgi:glyoxylase-like metal-dependent hydrolase (beta-lactamase superfamily II)
MFATMLAGALLLAMQSQEPDWNAVQVKSEKLADGVYVLTGMGGNIGVSTGEDGVFLIDDQYAQLTDKVRAAVASVSKEQVRFLLNTHWHGDHTGGNENLGKTGVVIVAQENVRKRMSVDQFIAAFNQKTPAAPHVALPVVTFADAVTFHLNGDEELCFHVPPAHTDGDAVVQLKKANVVHMGDTFFNGMYPFIDLSSGGSFEGMIGAAEKVLSLVDANTRIIPGHGPVADKAALSAYRDMLVKVRDRVKPLVAKGKSLDEVKATKPTEDLDAKWGGGFLKADMFLAVVYESLKAK